MSERPRDGDGDGGLESGTTSGDRAREAVEAPDSRFRLRVLGFRASVISGGAGGRGGDRTCSG